MAHASPSIESPGRNARFLVAARNSRRLISALDLIFSPVSALPSAAAVAPPPIAVDQARVRLPRSRSRSGSGQDQSTYCGRARRQEAQTPGQAPTTRTVHQPSNKSPSVRPPKDIRVAAFHAALRREGFTYLKQAGRFVDQRAERAPFRFCLPVTDPRGRLLRRATLAALKVWRAQHEAGLAAKAALLRQRIDLAERLAPKALPGCRADLTEAAAIAQLADDFLTRVAGFDSVEFKALIQMGWSAAQLREHGDAARAVADRKAVPA